MLYEIIGTAISSDRSVSYSAFRQRIGIERERADTYGISAADITKCVSVGDIVTDAGEIYRLLESISRDSVSVCGLEEYVCEYVDGM